MGWLELGVQAMNESSFVIIICMARRIAGGSDYSAPSLDIPDTLWEGTDRDKRR